jgi:HSP20 family protein
MAEKSITPIKTQGVAERPTGNLFTSLQREIDRVFDDFTRGWPSFHTASADLRPRMDIAETDKDIEISAELPGLDEKDVQVNIADNVLTIKGEKKAEKEEKDKNYHMVERSYGSFYRALNLPAGVNIDAIKATLANGVLKVTVPKPAAAQAKKVEVKSAA